MKKIHKLVRSVRARTVSAFRAAQQPVANAALKAFGYLTIGCLVFGFAATATITVWLVSSIAATAFSRGPSAVGVLIVGVAIFSLGSCAGFLWRNSVRVEKDMMGFSEWPKDFPVWRVRSNNADSSWRSSRLEAFSRWGFALILHWVQIK